ncbi:MAG: Asp-tRNA(Asn)/Glu-tRNA(Gln) amidotransferase subunit GatB, partial [Planctomycetota bacterium]
MAAKQKDPLAGSDLEAVIGLEVHVQLRTNTKIFCPCPVAFGSDPNSRTCPTCLGLPGALPSINRRAVEYACRVGRALKSKAATYTKFDRKNYFYPDLPKGYQVSQFDFPICDGGEVEFLLDGERRTVRLVRAHLEEDAGKSIHVEGETESWVDLNRAGTPLLEIVSEPDISSPAEAVAYFRALRLMMLYLGVSDCNMEEGSLRCDCNVSLRPKGSTHLETRTEIKNLNSFTFIESALNYEIARQRMVRESGGEIIQETRLFDTSSGETRSMRGKEEAHDYRYFPEPDLTPMNLDPKWVEDICSEMPELPLARFERYQSKLELSEYQADILVRDPQVATFFESTTAIYSQPKSIANWIINALLEELKGHDDVADLGVSPESFAELVKRVDDGGLSKRNGQELFKAMVGSEKSVGDLVSELGFEQISDDSFVRDIVAKVIAENPGPVDDVRAGKKKGINFLVGQVMRHSQGKA